ncbi:MAG TPA: DUF624 domain-containing protein [Actinopolymorphaceae bacterium]
MKPFRAFESVLAIGVTGLLWLLASAPIVTLGPATAAMFGVFAAWEPGQEPPSVWSTYWEKFRGHFRQALGLGLGLTLVGALLAIDAWYGLSANDAPLRPLVLAAAIFGAVVLLGTLVFLFPVLVSYPAPWRRVVRNAALFSAGYVWTTLLGLFTWAVVGLVVVWSPLLLPFAVAGGAWVVSRLTGRAFERYLVRQQMNDAARDTDRDDDPEADRTAGSDGDVPTTPTSSPARARAEHSS